MERDQTGGLRLPRTLEREVGGGAGGGSGGGRGGVWWWGGGAGVALRPRERSQGSYLHSGINNGPKFPPALPLRNRPQSASRLVLPDDPRVHSVQ